MDSDNSIRENKKTYEKPRLRVIELVAEEVMGIGCKTNASGGPLTFCSALTCSGVGS